MTITVYLLQASIFLVGFILVLPFAFVGRRGRNLPDGESVASRGQNQRARADVTIKGPPTLPIIGNLHQLPKNKPYLQYVYFPTSLTRCVFSDSYPVSGSQNGPKSTEECSVSRWVPAP
jgi:hypothetical protein